MYHRPGREVECEKDVMQLEGLPFRMSRRYFIWYYLFHKPELMVDQQE